MKHRASGTTVNVSFDTTAPSFNSVYHLLSCNKMALCYDILDIIRQLTTKYDLDNKGTKKKYAIPKGLGDSLRSGCWAT